MGRSLNSEVVLKSLLNSSGELLCATDGDSECLAFNDRFADRIMRVYGHDLSVGDSLVEAIPFPIERELIRSWIARAFAGSPVVESRWMGQGANRRYYRVTCSPILADGETVAVAIAAADHTETAARDERLQVLDAVVDASDDAMLSWDMGGLISSWSAGAERLYGYTASEMVGRHIEGLLPPGHENDMSLIMQAVSRGQRVVRLEAFGIRKDGTPVDIELTVGPITDEFGVIVGAGAVAHNITERKAIEEALRRSELKFEVAFRTSPDSVNINRLRDGVYVEVNEGFTALTGYTAEEVIGVSSLEIDIWADPEDRDKLVDGLRASGGIDDLEAVFRLKDGSVRSATMSARVIVIDDEPHILSVTRELR